jgi:hypothetical protein
MGKILRQNIIAASHRLRVVQQGFADEDEEQRAQYLSEELDKHLKEVPYGERQAFLEGLLAQFPTGLPDGLSPAGPACPADAGPSVPEDPVQLVELLLAQLASATPDQKEAVLDRLREAGVGPSPAEDASGPSIQDLKSTLHLPDGMGMHQERLASLASLLTEFVVKLERWTASVWAELSSKSSLRPPKQIEKIARQFLSEDQRDTEELTKELQLLQQFVTILMAAGRKAGDEVTRRHFHKFSPESIQASVEMEPRRLGEGFLTSKEIRYWRKYCELAQELGSEYVDREIVSVMAEYAETFLRKLERPANTTGGA